MKIQEVYLSPEEAEQCKQFARKSALTQKEKRSGGTRTRMIEEIETDIQRGKTGEALVKKFMKQFGIKIELDFNIYPRGQWDDGDFIVNGKKFSIKASKYFASWLLLETEDIDRGYVFDYYIFVNVDRNLKQGIIRGYATLSDLDGFEKLKKGEFLPGTRAVLDADNHGKKIHDLRQDWENLF